ncbi:DUF2875 domain-containing protein [Burkholderia stagnalis]|nr:DUF2875 domain-containing protein [Burkholderia stagnalis]RQY71529.1 DUF2875 domain-containing protein [Burkholderia stagnalis]
MNVSLSPLSRPRLRGYVLILVALALAWTAVTLARSYHYWENTGIEDPHMGSTIRNGFLVIVGLVAAAYAGQWIWRASHGEGRAAAVQPVATAAELTTPKTNSENAKILAGTGAKYALEIRAVGLAVTGRHQDTIWKQIVTKSNNYETVLSSDPKDYGENPDERRTFAEVAAGASFKYAAGEAVDHWPIPVIIYGPPKGADSHYRAAYEISDVRQKAGLGVTQFLWLDDANASSAAPAIDRLFKFFDEHPDVPAALVMSQDGMVNRWGLNTPGAPKEPQGAFIPPVIDSMSALLVARTDRVNKLVRPYQVDMPGDIDNTKTQYDVVKLWNFYWKEDSAFSDKVEAEAGGHFYGPPTMRSDWWISKLPELWKEVTNKGPGEFQSSPYLPVRWANWQVEEFDEAPLLGYLHRPVDIKLTDDNGKLLKRTDQVKQLQEGWKQAVATLPDGAKPTRVFYDTTRDREWTIPLTQALHGNTEGIDLGNVKEGYDVGRRIGNTGVSSALVQLSLATIANYEEGGSSATINLMDDGRASIVMVSPPDEATKAKNSEHRGPNPFRYRMPH